MMVISVNYLIYMEKPKIKYEMSNVICFNH